MDHLIWSGKYGPYDMELKHGSVLGGHELFHMIWSVLYYPYNMVYII